MNLIIKVKDIAERVGNVYLTGLEVPPSKALNAGTSRRENL